MKVSSEDGARAQHKEALAAHRVMLEARYELDKNVRLP